MIVQQLRKDMRKVTVKVMKTLPQQNAYNALNQVHERIGNEKSQASNDHET